MKPEIKKMWCEALRGGEYKQGKETLYDGQTNSYCCLGVLERLRVGPEGDINGNYLGQETIEWAGLGCLVSSHNPLVKIKGDRAEYLGICNDSLCMTFDEIADAIERSL